MNRISKGNMLLFITTVLFYGTSLIVSFMGSISYPMLLQIFAQALLVIPSMIYALVHKMSIPKMVRMKKTRPVNFIMAILVLACSYPVIMVLNLISMFFVENAVTDTMSYMLTNYGFFLPFFIVAVMPGFAEEFLFRGVVYSGYSKSYPVAGLLISAAAFGLMHGNFNQMPYAMFLGAVFVLMLEATDSIWVTMFMHFLLNGANVIMMYVAGPEAYMEGGAASVSVREMFVQMATESGSAAVFAALVIYVLIAVFFAAAACALIYLTFMINKRSLRACFRKKETDAKNRPLDFWLLGFAVIMILLIIFFE